MEVMPYQPDRTADCGHDPRPHARPAPPAGERRALPVLTAPDDAAAWQEGLPVLHGLRLTLRELHHDDAATLFAELTTEEVTRFISPPPTSVHGFERFIAWAHRERAEGRYLCFAVVPEGQDAPVGLFQIQRHDVEGGVAEWGFVLGAPYWGRGLFLESALLVLAFAFDTLGVRRLEARACRENGRGTGALRKLGAICERVLREAFVKDGRAHDQGLWVLTPAWWRRRIAPTTTAVH